MSGSNALPDPALPEANQNCAGGRGRGQALKLWRDVLQTTVFPNLCNSARGSRVVRPCGRSRSLVPAPAAAAAAGPACTSAVQSVALVAPPSLSSGSA